MQSLSAHRRVKSGGRGDEGFGFSVAGSGWCIRVRRGHDWVRAGYRHNNAEEEAGDDIVEEFVCEEEEFVEQDNDASCDDAPRDLEEDEWEEDQGSAEAY